MKERTVFVPSKKGTITLKFREVTPSDSFEHGYQITRTSASIDDFLKSIDWHIYESNDLKLKYVVVGRESRGKTEYTAHLFEPAEA